MSCRSTLLLLLSLCLAACASSEEQAAGNKEPSKAVTPSKADEQEAEVKRVEATEVIFETADGKEHRVEVEVVQTPAKIQRGLMHRRHLPPDKGMLFVFKSDQVRTFWMKNTLIPLDMVFVRSDMSVAGVVENATPLTLDQRTVGIPTQYVIEVNGGWTKPRGVEAGTTVRFENMPTIDNPPL